MLRTRACVFTVHRLMICYQTIENFASLEVVAMHNMQFTQILFYYFFARCAPCKRVYLFTLYASETKNNNNNTHTHTRMYSYSSPACSVRSYCIYLFTRSLAAYCFLFSCFLRKQSALAPARKMFARCATVNKNKYNK